MDTLSRPDVESRWLGRSGARSPAQACEPLLELPPDERAPILRAFWHQVPGGRPFMARLFGLARDATTDDFEAAVLRCPVFRLDPPRD